MTGKEVVRFVETELSKRWISKAKFYKESGISSATFSQWRTGVYDPSPEMLKRIEDYLGIKIGSNNIDAENDDTTEFLEWIREDFSHRALFESAKGLTTEQSYAVASFIEKLKAGDK